MMKIMKYLIYFACFVLSRHVRAKSTSSTPAALINIQKCLHLHEGYEDDTRRTRNFVTFDRHQRSKPYVYMYRAIDDRDVRNLLRLTACVEKFIPDSIENRYFGDDNDGGGNNVTYIGWYLRKVLPELYTRLIDAAGHAAEHASWYPHPKHLGMRCGELLQYHDQGELRYHTDNGSIYTLMVMISDIKEYTGGEFRIKERSTLGREHRVRVNKYDGLIFDSNADHAVDRLGAGSRSVLVVELWPFWDAAEDHLRPDEKDYLKRGHVNVPSFRESEKFEPRQNVGTQPDDDQRVAGNSPYPEPGFSHTDDDDDDDDDDGHPLNDEF